MKKCLSLEITDFKKFVVVKKFTFQRLLKFKSCCNVGKENYVLGAFSFKKLVKLEMY